jgi:naphthoate synthase
LFCDRSNDVEHLYINFAYQKAVQFCESAIYILNMVSDLFDESRWEVVTQEFEDITYHRAVDNQIARIAFDRPEVRNAFRPGTVDELYAALDHVRKQADIGCVILTGNGPSPKDGGWAFCSGGDQSVRGESGYEYRDDDQADELDDELVREAKAGRLHILEVQRLIRFMPKPVIAVVPGWAAGGGHSLHVVCDITLASEEQAKFRQTDADVASFDGGFGSAYLARQVGQKKAREIFFRGSTYSAEEAEEMGMVNETVPHDELEDVAVEWAVEITNKSPTSIRMLKYAFNLVDDGLIGQQVFAGEATRLAYMTDEAQEGRDAFLEGRSPDFTEIPWHY